MLLCLLQGVGLELNPENGNVFVSGGTNTVNVNGLASLVGSTEGSLTLGSGGGDAATLTHKYVLCLMWSRLCV